MKCINWDIVIDGNQMYQKKENVQAQLCPFHREININFMSNTIPDTLDHHTVDGTHCQQPNGASISAVADNLQNEVNGLYHMFWLTQEDSDPNNPYGYPKK